MFASFQQPTILSAAQPRQPADQGAHEPFCVPTSNLCAMTRPLRSALAAGAVFLAALSCARPPKEAWYHTSDVAHLATTGRPQLVEFFHPD